MNKNSVTVEDFVKRCGKPEGSGVCSPSGTTQTFRLPENKWIMRIGTFEVYHPTKYSRWKAFWLRFMGWEVEELK